MPNTDAVEILHVIAHSRRLEVQVCHLSSTRVRHGGRSVDASVGAAQRRHRVVPSGGLHCDALRHAFLRKQVLFSAGLWPLPEKTPLNPRSGERIVHDDYSVSAVLLETYPGFFLGGNLYRPAGKPGPFPAVVSPHGHWPYGRFENSEINSVPARAISLARQGHVVFAHDMVGWNDTPPMRPASTSGSDVR